MLFSRDLCNNGRYPLSGLEVRISQLGMVDDNTVARSQDERTLFRKVTGDKWKWSVKGEQLTFLSWKNELLFYAEKWGFISRYPLCYAWVKHGVYFGERIVWKVWIGSVLLGSGTMPHYVLVRERGYSLTQERWKAWIKSLNVSFWDVWPAVTESVKKVEVCTVSLPK